jgi:hypothetical protein
VWCSYLVRTTKLEEAPATSLPLTMEYSHAEIVNILGIADAAECGEMVRRLR